MLGILRSGPAYGYDIAGKIAEVGFSRPKGGTLYPILGRLESEGLVEPTWVEGDAGPTRKYYGLTASGVAAADEIADHWGEFAKGVSTLIHHQPRGSKQ